MFLAVVVIAVCLASLGKCDAGKCMEENGTAICQEGTKFPLDVSKTITKLVIKSMDLAEITNEDLINYENLEEIDFSDSGIVNIDENAFTNNHKLLEINLSHNKDLQIPEDRPFFRSKSLISLNLTDTGIESIPESFFEEMPNLSTLDLGDNEVEKIESALQTMKHLEKLIIMKDDNIDRENLCETTSIKQIIFKIIDDNENETKDIFNCVDSENDSISEIGMEKVNVSKELTEITTQVSVDEVTGKPEPDVAPEADFSEDCRSKKYLQFNGNSSCVNEDDSVKCDLCCNNEMIPETPIINPYICSYKTGKFTPETIPVCVNDTKKNNTLEDIVEIPSPSINRGILHGNTQLDTQPKHIDVKTSENMQVAPDTDEEQLAESTDIDEEKKTSNISGSNIVLGIIVVIMVVGAIGMGYKYWKSHHGYQNTKTDDIEEGKELQVINSHSKSLMEQNN